MPGIDTREVALRQRRLAAVSPALPESAVPAGTRGAILRASLILFAETGFHGTSIRQLAASVGITTATLYAHFPSKDDVLAELITVGHEQMWRALEAAAAEHTDPADRLVALVGAHARMHIDYAALAVVINNELHVLPAARAEAALAQRDKCFHLLADTIRAGAADGRFEVDAPPLAAVAIASMCMRIAHWYNPALAYTPDQIVDQYTGYALDLLRARRTSPTARP
ncbi:TetR/AcrR family transcriptional regulator [Nocardia sp. NPDC127579]|uniref:TetR/AcrR family transcriptional regulator n=1 Tax=Nocardia sp. NPDC127579 TaxID=3345402 RepID=UPI00364526E6